ncbi:MAG: reductive dehalogenase [Candidatus Thorarchaeota archaeon]
MQLSEQKRSKEREFWSNKLGYAMLEEDFSQFSQRNVIFSRVRWDPSYRAYGKTLAEKQGTMVGKKGYSRVGYAVQSAAWTIYDKYPQAFSWDRIPYPGKVELTQLSTTLPKYESKDPRINSKTVKRVGQIFGAADVGICEIDPKLIYSHNDDGSPLKLPEGVKYAIILLIEMDAEALRTSPELPASITTGDAYSRMAFSISLMGEFLRNLGYTAIQAGNDVGLSVPLAIKAGLGEFGRHGMLIHPRLGPNVRICKVFTDFPMESDSPTFFGVRKYCQVCQKCAKYCPPQAIPFDKNPTWESHWKTPSNNSGATYKWYVNVDTCYQYWTLNTSDCSNCLAVCQFGKPRSLFRRLRLFIIRKLPVFNPLWVWLDRGKGKPKIPRRTVCGEEPKIGFFKRNYESLKKRISKRPKESKKWWKRETRDSDEFWESDEYLGKKMPI